NRGLVLVAVLAACNSEATRPPATVSAPPVDWSRAVPASPPGGAREAGYVGAAECVPCHTKISDSYAHHGMARTGVRRLDDLDPAWLARIFDKAAPVRDEHSGYAYRPFRDGKQFFVEEIQPDGHS